MNNSQQNTINNTMLFVKKALQNAEGGHDWFHIERVYKNSILISQSENVDDFIVALGSLLHDIADAKFYNGDETVGPKIASEFLKTQDVDESIIEHVGNIINQISYKNSVNPDGEKWTSPE